jgi:hypothetical protein
MKKEKKEYNKLKKFHETPNFSGENENLINHRSFSKNKNENLINNRSFSNKRKPNRTKLYRNIISNKNYRKKLGNNYKNTESFINFVNKQLNNPDSVKNKLTYKKYKIIQKILNNKNFLKWLQANNSTSKINNNTIFKRILNFRKLHFVYVIVEGTNEERKKLEESSQVNE